MKKRIKRKSRVKTKKPQLHILNLKANTTERKRLELNARKFTRGNLSAWLRIAGTRYAPKNREVYFDKVRSSKQLLRK